eukprot:TRINITY_DN54197_c0_g2_i1.p1 TRINITY_DN54197_c0_g2~~TRINITY_DN54197_c0_g2_i1.p1  ORF type:complete len:428 (+),score=24.09 TRINITY_DN54197_c0_g2_i1:158-1441(+)
MLTQSNCKWCLLLAMIRIVCGCEVSCVVNSVGVSQFDVLCGSSFCMVTGPYHRFKRHTCNCEIRYSGDAQPMKLRRSKAAAQQMQHCGSYLSRSLLPPSTVLWGAVAHENEVKILVGLSDMADESAVPNKIANCTVVVKSMAQPVELQQFADFDVPPPDLYRRYDGNQASFGSAGPSNGTHFLTAAHVVDPEYQNYSGIQLFNSSSRKLIGISTKGERSAKLDAAAVAFKGEARWDSTSAFKLYHKITPLYAPVDGPLQQEMVVMVDIHGRRFGGGFIVGTDISCTIGEDNLTVTNNILVEAPPDRGFSRPGDSGKAVVAQHDHDKWTLEGILRGYCPDNGYYIVSPMKYILESKILELNLPLLPPVAQQAEETGQEDRVTEHQSKLYLAWAIGATCLLLILLLVFCVRERKHNAAWKRMQDDSHVA